HADFVLRCRAVTTPLRHVGACKHEHRNGAADCYLDVRARLRAEPMGFGAKPFSARQPAGRGLGTAPRVTVSNAQRGGSASGTSIERLEGSRKGPIGAGVPRLAGSRAPATRVRLRFCAGWAGTRFRAVAG